MTGTPASERGRQFTSCAVLALDRRTCAGHSPPSPRSPGHHQRAQVGVWWLLEGCAQLLRRQARPLTQPWRDRSRTRRPGRAAHGPGVDLWHRNRSSRLLSIQVVGLQVSNTGVWSATAPTYARPVLCPARHVTRLSTVDHHCGLCHRAVVGAILTAATVFDTPAAPPQAHPIMRERARLAGWVPAGSATAVRPRDSRHMIVATRAGRVTDCLVFTECAAAVGGRSGSQRLMVGVLPAVRAVRVQVRGGL